MLTKAGQPSSHDIYSRIRRFDLPGLQEGYFSLMPFCDWVSVWESLVQSRFCGPGWSRTTCFLREGNLTRGRAGGSCPFSILLSIHLWVIPFLLQLCTYCKKGSAYVLSNTISPEAFGPVLPHKTP